MKKLVTLTIIALALIISIYQTTKEFEVDDQNVLSSKSSETDSVEVFPYSNKTFASEKLKNLTMANEQCKERNLDYGTQVKNINNILVQTLEHELRNGKTERELLPYLSPHETFYDSYEHLLLQAKVNVEKEKYDFTRSVEILNEWLGLSVIKNFSQENISKFVEALKAIEGKTKGLKMSLTLKENVNKSEILALLDNNYTFNTYLESPLGISGSKVLSPSILFVLTANHLSFDEFEQVISLKSFNVNDIAIAVINGMPFEYIEVLVKQTSSIKDMPILVQSRFNSYANLADLAAARHNLELLKLLEQFDVYPTNELGIITGLDIAIMNLPDKPKLNANAEKLPKKYIETISYLVSKGYKAHGSTHQIEGKDIVLFRTPAGRSFDSSKISEPNLKEALHQISLIDKSHEIEQIQSGNSIVTKAIETMKLRISALNDKSKSCITIEKELLAEEGYVEPKETFELIERISKEGENVVERLHDIDPVLVNLWQLTSSNRNGNNERDTKFVNLIKKGSYQEALDYSASTRLTEYETDTLLRLLFRDFENLIPIWNARVGSTPPSSLMVFKRLPLETWHSLEAEGFDFSIKDKFGSDLFSPAAINSSQAIKFLLNINLKPETDFLGLDVLDLLLENTYETGKVDKSLKLIINQVETLETSHYSRIARIEKYFPQEYEKLVVLDNRFQLINGAEVNKHKFTFK